MREARERTAGRGDHSEHEVPARTAVAAESSVLAARGPSFEALGNRALLALLRSGPLQRKARVSRPGDPAELAADRAADAVVSGERRVRLARGGQSASGVQRVPNPNGAGTAGVTPIPDEVGTRDAEFVGQLSGGSALDEGTRGLMESRFGETFDEVRIHIGHRAAELADTVQALAFIVGEDIVFGAGQYAPETTEGRRLLAHELAHVIQQRRAVGALAGKKAAERDAQEAAHEVASGGTPRVRERAAPGSVQKQESPGEGNSEPAPISTIGPMVGGGTAQLGEGYVFSLTVENHQVASGRVGQPSYFRHDKGSWVKATKTLTINFWYGPWGKETLSTAGHQATANLLQITIVLIPHHRYPPTTEGDSGEYEDQPPIMAFPKETPPPKKPQRLPPKPGPQPQAEPPQQEPPQKEPENKPEAKPKGEPSQVSPEFAARLKTIQSNLESFTFNPWWAPEIVQAFRESSPAEFQQLQTDLGERGMTDVFDQLDPFLASIVGSLGPIKLGKAKLTEKRAEWLLEVSRFGSNQKGFMYYWMFKTMQNDDIEALLSLLASQSHLHDTVHTQPGMKEYLATRGIDLDKYQEVALGFWRGVGRGLKGLGESAMESIPAVGGAPDFRYQSLPEPYQSQFLESATKDFFKELTPGNLARGGASQVTLGASDIPIGLAGAGQSLWLGGGDIFAGKPGEGAEKITPVVVMILGALLGRRLARAGAGAGGTLGAAEAEVGLLGPRGAGRGGGAQILWEVRPNGQTAAGLDRFLVRDTRSGQILELVIDPQRQSGYAVHIASGRTVYFENGQLVAGPAGLLPAEAGLGLPLEPFPLAGRLRTTPSPYGTNTPPDLLLPPVIGRGSTPPGGGTPLLLAPWAGPPVRIPPPGMSTGELAEAAALQPMRPNAKLLPGKAGGYDAHQGGTKIINSEVHTTDSAGNPIIKRDVTLSAPDDAIQIKTMSGIDKWGQPSQTPAVDRVAQNVRAAIAKAYNQPKTRNFVQIPGTNIYERVNVEAPKKITIIVQVPGEITDEMRAIAQKTVDESTAAQALVPPIEVIVQPEQ